MKVLVLYEELAWYFINCINVLCKDYNIEVLIFCKKPNPLAPFNFKYVHPSVTIIERSSLSEAELFSKAKAFNPKIVFLAGWIYKPYISILKTLKPQCSLLGFDNQWHGSLKQILGSLYFKISLKSFLKKAFVPGDRQRVFARHLGFGSLEIVNGVYCCDYDLFASYYNSSIPEKRKSFPKRFLFAGRYVKEKGIEELWNAFIELDKEQPSEWELWCLGKGDIAPVQHKKIKHLGFRQPEEMLDIIKNTGIFVLPSIFEPWGVVIHEYAAAGFPILCTDKVGAGDTFVKNGDNGFVINSGNKQMLKDKLRLFMTMTESDLVKMSEKSHVIASTLTPELWAKHFMGTCK